MIRPLHIDCPACRQSHELFLGMRPPLVMLRCPSCGTPLLDDGSGIFILDERDLSDLAGIPLLSSTGHASGIAVGRSERPISAVDILDLKVILSRSGTIEEFLSQL